jgi:hypothetical protein
MGYDFDVIFTLNARGDFMLDVMRESFSLNDEQIFSEIRDAANSLRSGLAKKGIKYSDLKHALIPNTDKSERAFVFDWTNFDDAWYGREVIHRILPLLDKKSNCSILVGDWIPFIEDFNDSYLDSYGNAAYDKFLEGYRSTDTFYFVYINNLTKASIDRLEAGLEGHQAYRGSIDLTFTSPIKSALASMLMGVFLQNKSNIIQGHEDDVDISEDVNLSMFSYEDFGFRNCSVPSWLYSWFLSYKIETPISSRRSNDLKYALNALSKNPIPMKQLSVVLDDAKLNYLRQKKGESLRRAGFDELTAKQVALKIQEKVKHNYIYNLSMAKDAETLKFDIVIEIEKARTRCGLEYNPMEKTLRIVTMI